MKLFSHVAFVAYSMCIYSLIFIYILNLRNPRFGRRKEEDSHEALRCLLDGFRMEEIDVCINLRSFHVNTNCLLRRK